MVEISPKKLDGNWKTGYALDIHTLRSEFVGDNEYGHPQFESTYSPVGKLLHGLKYEKRTSALPELIETAANFISNRWKLKCDIVVPVPPSNVTRGPQPVLQIAQGIAKRLGWRFQPQCLAKKKRTQELKDVLDPRQRARLLDGAFHVEPGVLAGKSVLLVDDLYRSGSTLSAITKTLKSVGKAADVFILTMTKTRTRK